MAGFTGRDRMRHVLLALPDAQRKQIRAALIDGGTVITGTQKNLAPVSADGSHGRPPGSLRNSIKATPGDQDLPDYATLKSKRTVKDPELCVIITAGNSEVRYAHFPEFGTTKMHAEPFFYPGFRAQKSAVKRKINAAARQGIKDGLK